MFNNLNSLEVLTRLELLTFLIKGANLEDFIIGLLVFIIAFSPFGFAIITCLYRKISLPYRIYLSPAIGCSLSIALWSFIVSITHRVNFPFLISIIVLLTIVLMYAIYRRDKSIIAKKEIRATFKVNNMIPLVIFLFFLFLLMLVSMNRVAPCDVDTQKNGYFSLFLEYEQSYPDVHPFLNDTKLVIFYPLGANLLVAFLSTFSNISIQISMLLIQIITLSFSGLALYCILDVLTPNFKNKIYFLLSSIVFFYNSYLWGHLLNGGQLTASVAIMINISLLFFFILSLKKKKFPWYVLAGVLLGTLMLVQSMFFKWMALAIFFFSISQLIPSKKKDWQNFVIPLIVLLVGILWMLPWFLPRASSASSYLVTDNLKFLDYRYGGILLTFFAIGIVEILLRRKNLTIFLLVWVVSTLLLGGYMSKVYGSSIVIPIISAYGFLLIINLIDFLCRRAKIGVKKWRYLKIPMVFLFYLFFFVTTILDPRSSFSNGPIISDADISALTWLKKNTSYENTLILNQTVPHHQGRWVAVVSERRTIFARGLLGYDGPLIFSDREFENAYKNANWAFYNITDPEAYQIVKRLSITHIYLAAGIPFGNYRTPKEVYELYEQSPFVELIYSNNDPSKLHPGWNAPAKIYEVVYQESQNQG